MGVPLRAISQPLIFLPFTFAALPILMLFVHCLGELCDDVDDDVAL